MTYMAQGQFGFQQEPSPVAGDFQLSPAIVATSPEPGGRVWTVTLASWVRQMPTRALAQCRARITLGGGSAGGSANDTVLVDYPAQGTVFEVHGTNVRVEVLGTVDQADLNGLRRPPLLAAWLTAGRASQRPMVATLTGQKWVVASGNQAIENVPARARAYRILPLTGTDLIAIQASDNATPVTLAQDFPIASNGGVPVLEFFAASSRAQWFPLHPMAAVLNVQNGSGPGIDAQFTIQWLIELG